MLRAAEAGGGAVASQSDLAPPPGLKGLELIKWKRQRAAGAMTDWGTDHQRLIWAYYNVGAGTVPLCLHGMYAPVKSRSKSHPVNQDKVWTIQQVRLGKAPKRAVKILLGDFNAEPVNKIAGVTGKYAVRQRGKTPMDAAGRRLIANLREAGLQMVSTMEKARPKKRGGAATLMADQSELGVVQRAQWASGE